MRDMNGLENAFGKADEGFKNNISHTLEALISNEGRRPMKRISLRLAIAIAAACIMIIGTALALSNTWGILDFLSGRRIDVEVLPEAGEIIQKDMPQQGGKAEFAEFTVREAVYDGRYVYLAVEARPTSPDYLLLGTDCYPSDPIANMGPLFIGESGTVEGYARQSGKAMIHTWIGAKELGSCAIDFLLEDDGTLVYMLSGGYEGGEIELAINLSCGTAPFTGPDDSGKYKTDNEKQIPLSVTLENMGVNETVTSVTPVDFPYCGVRVERVTLSRSPMAVYTEIEYTVVDEEIFAKITDDLGFEFLDENGERLQSGAASNGSIYPDESGKRFLQKGSLRAMDILPDEITLSGYNIWNGAVIESHMFELK